MWLCRVGADPNYLADFLPGQMLTGTGIGLVMPSLSPAAPCMHIGGVPARRLSTRLDSSAWYSAPLS